MQDVWQQVMVQHMRRHAERLSNMFVVNATTPAQMFHALRRQLNRPFQKPLVLLTPKYLLHHRPATSALQDFTTGTFFNRVIDDGKVQPVHTLKPACMSTILLDMHDCMQWAWSGPVHGPAMHRLEQREHITPNL